MAAKKDGEAAAPENDSGAAVPMPTETVEPVAVDNVAMVSLRADGTPDQSEGFVAHDDDEASRHHAERLAQITEAAEAAAGGEGDNL